MVRILIRGRRAQRGRLWVRGLSRSMSQPRSVKSNNAMLASIATSKIAVPMGISARELLAVESAGIVTFEYDRR